MNKVFNLIRSTGFRRGPKPVIGGVCAGIARSLGVDANVVRLVTLALMVFAGLPLGVYIAIWVLTPAQNGSIPAQRLLDEITRKNEKAKREKAAAEQAERARLEAEALASRFRPAPAPFPTVSPEGVQYVRDAQDR